MDNINVKNKAMKFTNQELDIIWCSLEDSLNSDDFRLVRPQISKIMEKIEWKDN